MPILAGTKVEPIVEQLLKMPSSQRNKVKEITLDMANSMKLIAKKCFPQAVQVTYRFHVQKLAIASLQDLRIKHRWEATDHENEQLQKAGKEDKEYNPEIFSHGDTVKQLLVRSRYLLYKAPSSWTEKQKERTKTLFGSFPDIHKAYGLVNHLRNIFNETSDVGVA